MKKMYLYVGVILIVAVLGFIPLWPKPAKSGYIKINTWDKIQSMLGLKVY